MIPTFTIELHYRVFLKLTRRSNDMFDKLRELFLLSKWCNRVHFSEDGEIHYPISREREKDYRARGFVIGFKTGDKLPYVIVDQLTVLLECESGEEDELIEEIRKEFGNIFASIRVVKSYFTGVVAV